MRKTFIILAVILFFGIGCTNKNAYKFAVVGDLQPPDNKDYLPVSKKIIKQIAASEAKFLVILGDLISGTGDERWTQFDNLIEPVRQANKPIYAVIGNNDLASAKMGEGFVERFCKRYQVAATPGLWLVLLDTEAHADGYSDYELGAEQIAWLKTKPWERHLEAGPNPLLFFFQHRPVFRSEPMKRDVSHKYGRDKPAISDLYEELGADAVFSGHEHIYEKRDHEGIVYTISGGGGGSLIPIFGYHHYLMVEVVPNKKKWKVDVIKVKP